MPWRNFFRKRPSPGSEPQPAAPPVGSTPVVSRSPARRAVDPHDPAARERRRKRLERRIQDLRYDLALAESATREPNRWTERAEQLDLAIEQARRDAESALAAPPGRPGIRLPPTAVLVDRVTAAEPAEVRFRIGDEAFRYSEEIDWAERGHQKAEPHLRRTAGEVDALLPPDLPAERREELREHLAHGLATLAGMLRDGALNGKTTAPLTLADLASPCPVCGGWRDIRGRCPACQERQWAADRLRADADRLIKERNDQLEEARRWADRLPVLRRQLADAQAEREGLGEGVGDRG